MDTKTINKNNNDGGGFWIFLALLVLAFWGSPDLLDCIRIHLLSSAPAAQSQLILEVMPSSAGGGTETPEPALETEADDANS